MRLTTVLIIAILLCSMAYPAGAVGAGEQSQSSKVPVEDPAYAATTTTYSATLGESSSDGLEYWGGDSGSLQKVTHNGKEALQTNRDDGTNFVYFAVDTGDSSALPRSSRVNIAVQYWDGSKGAFRIEFDGYEDFAADTRVVQTTGSDEWKTAHFTLTTAKFTQRLNNGDFRINPLNGNSDIAIRNVTVTTKTPKLKIRQQQLGNIFLTNETPSVGLEDYSRPVSWTVERYDGTVVANGTTEAPGSEGIVLELPLSDVGHYRLMLRDAESGTPLRETSLAVLPPPETGYERYGVSTHYGQLGNRDIYRLETMQLLSRAGVGTFRDNMGWFQIEQSRGEYAFPDRYDAFMQQSKQYGLEPFIILAGTNPLYDNGATIYSDEGRRAFAEYSRAVVNRYDRIEYAEVYNEFNIPRFGDRGDGPANASPDYYAPLLNVTADHLEDSTVSLVGPATSQVPQNWLDAVFQRGALNRLDVISVHPYTAGPPDKIDDKLARVQQLQSEYVTEQMPLWVSENGWSTSTRNYGTSFDDNAAYLVRAHTLAFSEGVDRYYTYELIDQGPSRSDHQSNFGLVHTAGDVQGDYTPKPAYTALATLTRTLEDAPYKGEDNFSGAIESHIFDNPDGNGTVRVMWLPEKEASKSVTVEAQTTVAIQTMMGRTYQLTPTNGTVQIPITDEPIYVYDLGETPVSEHVETNPTTTTTSDSTTSDRTTTASGPSGTSSDQSRGSGSSGASPLGFSVPVIALVAVTVLATRRS